ncbi:tyrosine homologous recombinase [Gordonia phage Camerico]|nr:tyrosine homologous recombinase [Gordonia phage Camerico]
MTTAAGTIAPAALAAATPAMNIPTELEKFESALFRSGRSRNTVVVYTRAIRRFLESGYSDPLDWLVADRLDGASAAKIRGNAAALKSWAKYRDDAAAIAALSDYKLPTLGAPTPHPVPGGVNIVRAVLMTVADPRARCLIALGALAGLRVSESRSIDSRCWDLASNTLVVRGKGDKTRNIPVSEELFGILTKNMPSDGSKFVPFGDKWARVQITRAFDKLDVKHADGSSISSHDLRATFATEVYGKTKDIRLVQYYLGHSSVEQTQVYIKIADQSIRNGVNL